MRSLLRSALGFFTVAIAALGCGKADPPPAPADVTFHVPAMN